MFGTSGIRGTFGETITSKLAVDVGRAVAAEGATRVVVGRDSRETGDVLERSVTAGLLESGTDVVALDLAATPTVARAVRWADADAGIVVTASHNPATDNGLKLWNPGGLAFTADQRAAISQRVVDDDYSLVAADDIGSTTVFPDAVERHARVVADRVGFLDGLSVVVDVGNGAGLVTVEALERAGADVTTLNAQPDGNFPGRPSEPTEETTVDLQRLVASTDADLGIAHDGDADRTMVVDERGQFVDGDRLFGIFAAASADRGDRVATPVNTSSAVEDYLADRGIVVERTAVGDGFVAERTREDGVVFGGEPSGAWIWAGECACPDGPLAAGMAATLARRHSLSERVGEIARYPLRRDAVETDDKAALMRGVERRVSAIDDDVTTLDGVRVDTGDGWYLIRASGTQALVRITAEAPTDDRVEDLMATARDHLDAARHRA